MFDDVEGFEMEVVGGSFWVVSFVEGGLDSFSELFGDVEEFVFVFVSEYGAEDGVVVGDRFEFGELL